MSRVVVSGWYYVLSRLFLPCWSAFIIFSPYYKSARHIRAPLGASSEQLTAAPAAGPAVAQESGSLGSSARESEESSGAAHMWRGRGARERPRRTEIVNI